MDSINTAEEVSLLSTESMTIQGFQPILQHMPMMRFEKHLLTQFSDSLVNTDRRQIEIPIYFGIPMLLLREKHEIELAKGKSFLESDPPKPEVITALVDRLLISCTSIDDIVVVLSPVKPLIIFHVVLELLRRLNEPLLPITLKTAQVVSRVLLLEPSHPYEFVIEEELYREILRYHVEQGEESGSRFKRNKPKTNDTIQPLIQKYYSCNDTSRAKMIKLLNRFNKCIYHDLHQITDMYQRNLTRFLIRNFVHLVRRYNNVMFLRLCHQRNERWPVARNTIRPHILQFSYTKMAEMVGPAMIYQANAMVEQYADVEKRTMLNILVSRTDRMWLPNQKAQDILINMETSYCHPNCVCGRGLNIICAPDSRSR